MKGKADESHARRRGEYGVMNWNYARATNSHRHTIFKRGKSGQRRRYDGGIYSSAVNLKASNRAMEICAEFGCEAANDYEEMTETERRSFSRSFAAWQRERRRHGEDVATSLWLERDPNRRRIRAEKARRSVRSVAKARRIAANVRNSIEVMPLCPRCDGDLRFGYPFELYCLMCGYVHYMSATAEEKRAEETLYRYARMIGQMMMTTLGVSKHQGRVAVYHNIRAQMRARSVA